MRFPQNLRILSDKMTEGTVAFRFSSVPRVSGNGTGRRVTGPVAFRAGPCYIYVEGSTEALNKEEESSMPIITIEITPQSYEKKTEIARVFTEELHRITNIPREPISIIFHEQPEEYIASGGVMLKE